MKLMSKDNIDELMDFLNENNGHGRQEKSNLATILKSYTGYKNEYAKNIKFYSTKNYQSMYRFSFKKYVLHEIPLTPQMLQ